MRTTIKTAGHASRIIKKARAAGWREGAICDFLGVHANTIIAWEKSPMIVPHQRFRDAVDRLEAKLLEAKLREPKVGKR